MAVASKQSPVIPPRKGANTAKRGEPSLLMSRLKELDREFARQTKQLTRLVKEFGKKMAKNADKDS